MILFNATSRRACALSDDKLTTGSVGIPVEFIFSDDWTAAPSRIAVFRGSGVSVDVALLEDSCTVPPEVLTQPGSTLTIGVYGTDAEGTVVIPTVYAEAGRIVRGAEPSGIEPTPQTQPLIDQLLAAAQAARDAADEAERLAQSIRDDADNGEFDGEDGADGSGVWYTTKRISGDDNPFVLRRDLIGRQGATVQVHDLLFAPDVRDEGEPTTLYEITSVGTACALNRLCKMQGEDGTSPGVTITEIEGGHRVTITDEDHPQGQSFDVMDGQGGSGSSDYDDLTDKPQINSVTLSGNKSAADLGLAPAGAYVKPSSGIPAADLSASVQARLDPDVLLCVYGTTQSGEIQDALDGGILPVALRNDDYYMYSGYTDSQGYVFTRSTLSSMFRISCKNNVWSSGALAIPQLSSATPAALGTASAGRAGSSSKADHVHPMPSAADVGAVAANQGVANANKVLTVGSDGTVSPEDNRFVVTLTPTEQDLSGVMDKTCAEITAAYEAGKDIWLEVDATAMGYDLWRVKATIEAKASGENYGQVMGFLINLQLTPPSMIFIFTEFNTSGDENRYTTQIYPLATGQWTGGSY